MAPTKYEHEFFKTCCFQQTLVACCGCNGPDDDNLMPAIWQIQDAPGMSSPYFVSPIDGSTTTLKFTWGCEKFDIEHVRRVELHDTSSLPPFPGNARTTCNWLTTEDDRELGKCCELGCTEPDGSSVGHGGPEIYRKSIMCYMSCSTYDAIPPVDPIIYWYLDCFTELYCADSEWGNPDDCFTYDEQTTGPCHPCGDRQPMSSEAECLANKAYFESLGLECGECYQAEAQPGSPGTPAFVDIYAGFAGSCACARGYRFLDPNNPACATMLEDLGSDGSDLPEWNCNDCNTLVLYQYRPEGETNPFCLSCIHDGADLPCQCGDTPLGFSYGRGCCNPPAVITICPWDGINGSDESDSDSDEIDPCDYLCCGDDDKPDAIDPIELTAQSIPEGIHFQIQNTSSSGYLTLDEDGLYRGGIPPIKLVVDKENRTLNGKPLQMLDDEIFWGIGTIGNKYLGFVIEVMA